MKKNRIDVRGFFKSAGVIIIFVISILGTTQAFGQVPGVTDTSIKIGIFGPFTGPIALYGKTAHLNDAIFQEMVNKVGGIHGRKIEAILEDDGCEPVKGVAAVKKLVYQDKVFMLSGGLCSNVVLAAKKEIVQAGVPLVGMGAVADAIYEPVEKNVFTAFISASYIARAMADFGMSKPGVKRVAIIKQTDEWGTSNYTPLAKYLKEKYNIVPVIEVAIESSATDATPQVLAIKEANPDLVFTVTFVIPTSIFLRDSYKLGLNVPMVGTMAALADEQYKRVGIPEALKQFFSTHLLKYTIERPEMDRWRELLKKYYPKDEFDANAANGISTSLVIMEVLKRVGRDLTREKFIQELEKLDHFSPDISPIAAPLSFSPTNHVGMKGTAFATMATGKLAILFNWKDYENLIKK
jgi:branched-chain amino acid transport system substrate-binding protein